MSFILKKNIELSKLKLQEDEVQNVKFSSNKEIRNMVKKGEFYKYIYLSIFDNIAEKRYMYEKSSVMNGASAGFLDIVVSCAYQSNGL